MNNNLHVLEYSFAQASFHVMTFEEACAVNLGCVIANETGSGYICLLASTQRGVLAKICSFLQELYTERDQPFSEEQKRECLQVISEHQDQLFRFDPSVVADAIHRIAG